MSDSGDIRELGDPLGEYQQNAMPALAAIIAGVIMGAMALVGALNANLNSGLGVRDRRPVVILAVLGVGVLGVAAVIAIRLVRRRGVIVTVYRDGFVYHLRQRTDVFRWDDIARVWQHVTRNNPGLYSFYRPDKNKWLYSYTVERKDGTKRNLGNLSLDGIEALGETLQTEVTRHLLPGYIARLQTGETLRFDELALDNSGLHFSSKLLGWHDVARVSMSTTHYVGQVVAIKQKGQHKDWARITGSTVPNLYVFLALVEQMSGKSPGSSP